jgi:hypothetical protein
LHRASTAATFDFSGHFPFWSKKAMSTDDDALKRRYREFMELLPLTLALAGLSSNEGNRAFTSEQLELRTQAIGNAFKFARQAVREAVKAS